VGLEALAIGIEVVFSFLALLLATMSAAVAAQPSKIALPYTPMI